MGYVIWMQGYGCEGFYYKEKTKKIILSSEPIVVFPSYNLALKRAGALKERHSAVDYFEIFELEE